MLKRMKIPPLATAATVLVAALLTGSLSAQTPKAKPMNQYLLIVRAGGRQLPAEDIQKRQEAVQKWAIGLVDSGKFVDSRICGQAIHRTPAPAKTDPEETIGAVVIVQVSDLDEALKIAKDFPGIAYGGSVEVREANLPPRRPQN